MKYEQLNAEERSVLAMLRSLGVELKPPPDVLCWSP